MAWVSYKSSHTLQNKKDVFEKNSRLFQTILSESFVSLPIRNSLSPIFIKYFPKISILTHLEYFPGPNIFPFPTVEKKLTEREADEEILQQIRHV